MRRIESESVSGDDIHHRFFIDGMGSVDEDQLGIGIGNLLMARRGCRGQALDLFVVMLDSNWMTEVEASSVGIGKADCCLLFGRIFWIELIKPRMLKCLFGRPTFARVDLQASEDKVLSQWRYSEPFGEPDLLLAIG